MAVLIDPPRWPAHGTWFSHLVSDTSLAELHAFAAAAGVPLRAFDHDHYDVSEQRYHHLVSQGAVEVSERELLLRLRASGLRVRPAQRTPSAGKVIPGLRATWERLLPSEPALGEELLARWSEPHRRYHDVRHLAQSLAAAELLAGGEPPRPVLLALWFHDAVYDLKPGQDEERSALLASKLLAKTAIPAGEADEVARLVRLTARHVLDADDDAGGAMVLDADLSILGQIPGRYDVYVRDVRLEYGELPDSDFRRGRIAVIDSLLALDPLFSTERARTAWEATARRNLAHERARWLMEGDSDSGASRHSLH